MRQKPRVLRTAEFSPKAIPYSVLTISIVFVLTLVGILALPIVVPIALWYYKRFFATLEVVLTSREPQVSRGVLNRQEKSIPLEKITDLAVIQGPVMRFMGIKGLQVETAGQSGGAGGALVRLIGVIDTDGFRDDALDQRDKVTDAAPAQGPRDGEEDETLVVLREIRDSLGRIEKRLPERTD